MTRRKVAFWVAYYAMWLVIGLVVVTEIRGSR